MSISIESLLPGPRAVGRQGSDNQAIWNRVRDGRYGSGWQRAGMAQAQSITRRNTDGEGESTGLLRQREFLSPRLGSPAIPCRRSPNSEDNDDNRHSRDMLSSLASFAR